MNKSELFSNILNGRALLFVGAGFARGAFNIRNEEFMTGSALAAHLSSKARLPAEARLEVAATAFTRKFKYEGLEKEIYELYSAKSVLPFHEQISKLPWRMVFTTNYDNVLEFCEPNYTPISDPSALESPLWGQRRYAIHLNGFVNHFGSGAKGSRMTLSLFSYDSNGLEDSTFGAFFRREARMASAIVFIGYSLFDLDVRRLLRKTAEQSKKTCFILGKDVDWHTEEEIIDYGTLLKVGAKEFAKDIQAFRKTFIPAPPQTAYFTVDEFIPEKHAGKRRKINDSAALALFMNGDIRSDLIDKSLELDAPYFLRRDATNRIMQLINGGQKNIVLTSFLGNGKTLVLEGLKRELIESSYRVFQVTERCADAWRELEDLGASNERIALLVDNYGEWLDAIRAYCGKRSTNTLLICTIRTSLHDVQFEQLLSACKVSDIPNLNLDKLNEREVQWFLEIMNHYALWGDDADRSDTQKMEILIGDCKSEIHQVLLDMLQSPSIKDRVKGLIDLSKFSEEEQNVVISILVFCVLAYDINVDNLVDIWGSAVVSESKFQRLTHNLIDFDCGRVRLRSAIAARFLLGEVFQYDALTNALSLMFRNCARHAGLEQYEKFCVGILRFSNLNLLLDVRRNSTESSRKRVLAQIIGFYEQIKSDQFCKNNPLFWLQYGIACLSINDLFRARTYFQQAYTKANSSGKRFDTFQIDNHFSRLLLTEAENTDDAGIAFTKMDEARANLATQLTRHKNQKPFRVASLMSGVCKKHWDEWNSGQQKKVRAWIRNVIKEADALPSAIRELKDVAYCVRALRQLESKLDA